MEDQRQDSLSTTTAEISLLQIYACAVGCFSYSPESLHSDMFLCLQIIIQFLGTLLKMWFVRFLMCAMWTPIERATSAILDISQEKFGTVSRYFPPGISQPMLMLLFNDNLSPWIHCKMILYSTCSYYKFGNKLCFS